jgi:capsular polysaccharide export protein
MFLSRLKYLLSPLIKMLFLNGAGRWLKRTIYLFFKRFLLQSIRAGRLSFLYPHALVLGQLYEDKQLLQITLKAAASRRVPLNNAQIRLAHNVLGDIKKGQDYSAYKEYEVFYQVFQQKAFRSIESALNTGCKKLLFVSTMGPGDDIRFAAFFKEISRMCSGVSFSITCDPRLLSLFKRSFPTLRFVPVRRIRNGLIPNNAYNLLPDPRLSQFFDNDSFILGSACDGVLLMHDALAALVTSIEAVPSKPYLIPDETLLDHWAARLEGEKHLLKIGISWRSMINTVNRSTEYVRVKDFSKILGEKGCAFYNTQYAYSKDELRYLADHPANVKTFEDLDTMNDFDSLAALMCNLDLLISPNTSTAILGGALGIPSLLIAPTMGNRYWGKYQTIPHDYWFPSIHYVWGRHPGDVQGLLSKLKKDISFFSSASGNVQSRTSYYCPEYWIYLGKRFQESADIRSEAECLSVYGKMTNHTDTAVNSRLIHLYESLGETQMRPGFKH